MKNTSYHASQASKRGGIIVARGNIPSFRRLFLRASDALISDQRKRQCAGVCHRKRSTTIDCGVCVNACVYKMHYLLLKIRFSTPGKVSLEALQSDCTMKVLRMIFLRVLSLWKLRCHNTTNTSIEPDGIGVHNSVLDIITARKPSTTRQIYWNKNSWHMHASICALLQRAYTCCD